MVFSPFWTISTSSFGLGHFGSMCMHVHSASIGSIFHDVEFLLIDRIIVNRALVHGTWTDTQCCVRKLNVRN